MKEVNFRAADNRVIPSVVVGGMYNLYGTLTVRRPRGGVAILPFPAALTRDFRLRVGDFATLPQSRKEQGIVGRFCGTTARGWLRQLPGGRSYAVRRPH